MDHVLAESIRLTLVERPQAALLAQCHSIGVNRALGQNGIGNVVGAITEEQQIHYLWDADRLREFRKMAEELAKDSELHRALMAPPQTPFSDPDTRLTH